MIRVVLADDHAIVRHGVRQLCDAQPDIRVVAEAADGEEALRVVAATPADVLVLDLSLPKVSGVELVRRVREAAPRLAIIVFTMYPEDQLALHFLSAGVAAYLSKDRAPQEMLAAIRRVHASGRYLTERLSDLAIEVGGGQRELPHETLTPRERDVFLLLVAGKTVSEVAIELGLSGSTVSNHVAKIRDKLGAASLGDVLRYAHRVGLLG